MEENTPEVNKDLPEMDLGRPQEESSLSPVNMTLKHVLEAKARLQNEVDSGDAAAINPYSVYEVCEAYMTHPEARHFRLGRAVVRYMNGEPEEDIVVMKQTYRSELDIYVSGDDVYQLAIETTSIHPKKKWRPAIAMLGNIAFVEDAHEEFSPETTIRLQPPVNCNLGFNPDNTKPPLTKSMAERVLRLPHIAQAQFSPSGDKADQQ